MDDDEAMMSHIAKSLSCLESLRPTRNPIAFQPVISIVVPRTHCDAGSSPKFPKSAFSLPNPAEYASGQSDGKGTLASDYLSQNLVMKNVVFPAFCVGQEGIYNCEVKSPTFIQNPTYKSIDIYIHIATTRLKRSGPRCQLQ